MGNDFKKLYFLKWFSKALWAGAVGLLMVSSSFALTSTEPDIVVPNLGDNSVSTIVNVVGKGLLRLPEDLPGGPAPVFIATGDFNEDRLKDLVIVNVDGALTFKLGQGNGAFAPVLVPFSLGYLLSDSLAVGDFNEDGHDDILVSGQGTRIQVLLGDGQLEVEGNAHNHFIAQEPVVIGTRTNAVAVADINEDGHLDAIVCDYDEGSVKILTGNGSGGLLLQLSLSTGGQPQEVDTGDFNADGHVDVAVAGGGSAHVSVYLGNGDGTFAPELQVFTNPDLGATGTTVVAVADFNNDGFDDFATRGGSPEGDVLTVQLWDPAGDPSDNFVSGGTVPAAGLWLAGLTADDFNADGRQDVVFTNAPVSNTISVYFGDGTGNLGGRQDIAVGAGPNEIAVLDVNPCIETLVTSIGFFKQPGGAENVTEFSSNDTLHITIQDLALDAGSTAEVKLFQGDIVCPVPLGNPSNHLVEGEKLLSECGFAPGAVAVRIRVKDAADNSPLKLERKANITITG